MAKLTPVMAIDGTACSGSVSRQAATRPKMCIRDRLYMYWLGMPITASAHQAMAMSGPPRDAGDPSLTLLLVAILIVSAIWQLDTMSRYSANPQLAMASIGGSVPTDVVAASGFEPETSDPAEPWLAPRLEITSRIVMALSLIHI